MKAKGEKRERYVIITLFGLAAPLAWAIHFACVYLIQQLLCNDYSGTDNSLVAEIIAGGSIVVVVILGIFILNAPRLSKRLLQLDDKQELYSKSSITFLHYLTRVLGGISVVAIIWTATSVIFLGECSSPY